MHSCGLYNALNMDAKRGAFSLVCILVTCSVIDCTDCPDTWVPFEGSCYLFGHQKLTFVEAEHYCNQHSAHLVHVEGQEENAFIKDYLRFEKGDMWWMGLTDDEVEGIWKWYGEVEKPEFTNWAPGQPDNGASHEDCAEFDLRTHYGWDGKWNDVYCHALLLPICERTGLSFDNNGIIG
ncbi:C-type lectin domain family 10 member A-like [Mercenaria mercenaria]|uniref:C-type lectin domain family 10 member A-like n=1 Tax=Mercenaria mercenaria TaxID=6596 RepID=UPI00234F3F83|nr:C-type lectin domain family 10 member A-like [Mercenaria mercenaria]